MTDAAKGETAAAPLMPSIHLTHGDEASFSARLLSEQIAKFRVRFDVAANVPTEGMTFSPSLRA